jgi:BarA-like signal transduction histidine kinase
MTDLRDDGALVDVDSSIRRNFTAMEEKVAKAIASVVNTYSAMPYSSPWSAHLKEARAAIAAMQDDS